MVTKRFMRTKGRDPCHLSPESPGAELKGQPQATRNSYKHEEGRFSVETKSNVAKPGKATKIGGNSSTILLRS